MAEGKEAREARRQRILNRGADRLTFITGAAKLLAQPARVVANENETIQERIDAKQGSIQEINGTEKKSQNGNALIQEGTSGEQQQKDAFETSDNIKKANLDTQQALRAFEMGDNNKDANLDTQQGLRTFASSLLAEIPAAPKDELVSARREPARMSRLASSAFSLKGLSASIDCSKGPRALLAVAVALTVVIQTLLASCKHPPGGASLSLFANVQPMILLVTTSISLVFGMMLLESSKLRRKDPNGVEDIVARDNLAQMLNVFNKAELALSSMLVLRKAVGSFSLDCSIYVVALVCILPFVQAWAPYVCA